jgi:hypothetical protein
MSEADKERETEASGVRDAEVVELVTDPAVLEHLAEDSTLSEGLFAPQADALVLDLEDLLPDVEGEVVLLAEGGVPLSVVAHEPVTGSGIVEQHVTASGVDVEGLYYYSFESGVTLYSDTDIVIVDS